MHEKGLQTWCKLGDVYFNLVREETVNYENDVTDKPVEDGTSMIDHIDNKPITLNVTGAIFHRRVFPTYIVEGLREIATSKEIVEYIGAEYWGDVVVTNFSNTYNNDLKNGVEFNLTLQQVRVANKVTTNINTGGFAIPDIEKLKEQIQDTKQDKKDAKREAKQTIKNKKKEAEKAAKKAAADKKKAQAKAKKKTKKGTQTKKPKKAKLTKYQKIMTKY